MIYDTLTFDRYTYMDFLDTKRRIKENAYEMTIHIVKDDTPIVEQFKIIWADEEVDVNAEMRKIFLKEVTSYENSGYAIEKMECGKWYCEAKLRKVTEAQCVNELGLCAFSGHEVSITVTYSKIENK